MPPTQSGGDGGGGGGGGGGGAAGGGSQLGGLGRAGIIIKPPGGQERPVDAVPAQSRSAPCPGCTGTEGWDDPWGGDDDEKPGGAGDPFDILGFVLRGFGGRFHGGVGRPGGGDYRGFGGGSSTYIPPGTTRPPGSPGGGGTGPGDDPGGDPGGGLASFQPGRPGSSAGGLGGAGRDLNALLGQLLGFLIPRDALAQPARTYNPLDQRYGGDFSAFNVAPVRGAGAAPPPPPPKALIDKLEREP
jgi:hypothetical protein